VALAIRLDPHFITNLKQLIVCGGSTEGKQFTCNCILVFVIALKATINGARIIQWSDYTMGWLLTYLFTPRSRVLFEKLTGSQLVKRFPAFYETRMSITAFTGARHLSLS